MASETEEANDVYGSPAPASSREYYLLLMPQALVGLVDSISMMVVAPSLIFYILELGGTKEQYGIILSVFSFASFLFKPVLGYWCDKAGCKFRQPYLVSIVAAMMGGFLYFYASAFTGRTAIAAVFFGRMLGGLGAANSTLGFTYIAQVIPHDQMTKMSAVLSMVRIMGMVAAPGLNVFLDKLEGFSIFSIPVTPLNSVGLFLFLANAMSFLVIYLLLKEPLEVTKPEASPVGSTDKSKVDLLSSLLSLDIILPNLSILVMNANFQLVEVGLAPAASDILGWGPVGISTAFGFNAVFMFILIVVTFQLSSMGVKDQSMLEFGWMLSIVGYGSLYFLWNSNASMWEFVTPFVLSTAGFPFLGAPTRSFYTKAVAASPLLRNQQGTMQAIMSMAASVAGFVAPGLIAAFVLRTPQQVAASEHHREFSPYALFAPIFSILLLAGYLNVKYSPKEEPLEEEKDEEPQETTPLLDGGAVLSGPAYPTTFHPLTEDYRRHSVTLMGISEMSVHNQKDAPVGRHTVRF
jgi:MFS family permease